MLTDLSFLNEGANWPPKDEIERLDNYIDNRLLFEGKHTEVFKDHTKRLTRIVGNYQDIVSFHVIANYFKLISLKVVDLLLGEKPTISVTDEGKQSKLDELLLDLNWHSVATQVVIDSSRYGDGLFYIRKDGKGILDLTQPHAWFKVVNPENIKDVIHHVIAWTYQQGEKWYLSAKIHSKGSYEERKYLLEKGIGNKFTIIRAIIEPTKVQTNIDDFLIIQAPMLITSDRDYGISDYDDLHSIVSELEVRVAQISRVLDKHADPSVSGPSSALTMDEETGAFELKMSNFFARDNKEDPEMKYIIWDANMEANFKHIEKLLNMLYTLSEMGSAIMADMQLKTGNVPSGSALRRMMTSALSKVQRFKNNFEPALKKAIAYTAQLSGIDLKPSEINIEWQDGLPGDPVEEADIINKRTGNKQTMSVYRAIRKFDGMSEEAIEEEQGIIADEQAANMPIDSTFTNTNTDVNSSIDAGGDSNIDVSDADSELSYNGAQIESALSITEQVAAGTLATDAAIIMLSKFLRIDEETAKKIVNAQKTVKAPINEPQV